jgi:hypothetical protein
MAMQYLLAVNSPPYPNSSFDCWMMLEAMRARCGLEETNTHLKRARQIYRMIIPKQEK